MKGLAVYNNLDLLNGLALGCYQPSLEVLMVLYWCIQLFYATSPKHFVYTQTKQIVLLFKKRVIHCLIFKERQLFFWK